MHALVIRETFVQAFFTGQQLNFDFSVRGKYPRNESKNNWKMTAITAFIGTI